MENLYLEMERSGIVQEAVTISGKFKESFERILDTLIQNRGNIVWNLFLIALILLGARLLLKMVSAFTARVMDKTEEQENTFSAKRTKTLMTLLRSVARYVIYFVGFLLILSILGMGKPLNNLIVTAGIGSLAIGFGAQNLVRDVVSGMFMIFENQFSVGDYIKIDDVEGTVEATAMRVTYLRSMKGDQIIIPNGTINRVINYHKGSSLAKIIISTAYEANTREVIEIIDRAVQRYAVEHADLIEEPPVVQGITNFGTSSVDIGVICKVKSMQQWEVERGLRLAVKEEFDRSGIAFPYPHCVVVPYQQPEETVRKEEIFVESQNEREDFVWNGVDGEA